MWPAPEDLVPYVTGLHLYVVDENDGEPNCGAFDPSFAALRIALVGGAGWRVRFVGGEWFNPPVMGLFGPTSVTVASESGAGILLNGGLRPRGWLRLVAAPAQAWANRVEEPPFVEAQESGRILQAWRETGSDDELAEAYFAFVRARMTRPVPDHDIIATMENALADPAILTVAGMCDVTGLPLRRLQRTANRAFGFPPKLLLRRARFLRSLHALRAARQGEGATVIDSAYTDYSHFVRDARAFLGMSPQTFVGCDTPLLRQSLEMRTKVIGSPAQPLDRVGV